MNYKDLNQKLFKR